MAYIRLAGAALISILLSACGGGSSGSTFGNTFGSCDPGTAVQLARPAQGQTGVSTGQNPIEIVASSDQNTLHANYSNFSLILQPQNGGGSTITSSPLNIVPDNSGPHPFTSDFFYSGSVPTLQFGTVYTVLLNEPTLGCTPVAIGSFST